MIVLPAFALAVAVATAPVAAGGEAREPAHGPDDNALDAMLGEAVVGERVDYGAVQERWLPQLELWLDRGAEVDPARLPHADRFAFYINLYNATMIRAVVERRRTDWTPAADDFRVFEDPLVRLGGRRLSLNALEHDVMRKEFDDPRLHVALVCAARSCPPLSPRAWRAEDLETRLEEAMRRFLNDPARNRIDHPARVLHLSQIFEWYAEDFGGAAAVAGYIDRYVEADVAGYAVRFLPYSWELNAVDAERPAARGPD